MSLITELNRRNVFRVTIAYVVAAWVIAQVADLVLDNIGAPPWVMQTLLFLLAIGFVVAIVFSWAFEVTPEGIKAERNVVRDEAHARQAAGRLNIVTIALVVTAIGLLLTDRLLLGRIDSVPAPEAVDQPIVQLSESEEPEAQPADDDRESVIAVLPFKATGSEDGGFLAGGLHDDLLTRLAKLGALKVISRTSMMEYAGTSKNMRQISDELNAKYILEGGVQARGNRVRVNAQLIDAPVDEHVWADTYDRELTAANLFDIQAELAAAIAGQLKVLLTESDRSAITDIPTTSLEAYNAYLRGLDLRDKGGHNSAVIPRVIAAFEQAVSLDPDFTLAWAQLSIERSRAAQGSQDPAKGVAALSAKNRAAALNPQLYEVGLAGVIYLYRVEYEYSKALTALEVLGQQHNLTAPALMLKSFLLRRLGRFEEAYQSAQVARRLDPRSVQIATQSISIAWLTDRCDEANELMRAALALAPDVPELKVAVAHGELQCNGDADRANALLDTDELGGYFHVIVAELAASAARDWEKALAITRQPLPGADTLFVLLTQLDGVSFLRQLRRKQEAEDQLKTTEKALAELEKDSVIAGSRQLALARGYSSALRSRGDETLRWLAVARERMAIQHKNDRALEVSTLMQEAIILTEAGVHSAAVAKLTESLATPGGDRFPLIDTLPEFDALKSRPDYQALQKTYGGQ